MGAQETIANSLHIFIAIVSHKGLAAYALGSSIVDSQVRYRRPKGCVGVGLGGARNISGDGSSAGGGRRGRACRAWQQIAHQLGMSLHAA